MNQPMRRILPFEIGVALKDRPRVFQIITLVLFAFSLMTILVGSLVKLAAPDKHSEVRNNQVSPYAGFAASAPTIAISAKK